MKVYMYLIACIICIISYVYGMLLCYCFFTAVENAFRVGIKFAYSRIVHYALNK